MTRTESPGRQPLANLPHSVPPAPSFTPSCSTDVTSAPTPFDALDRPAVAVHPARIDFRAIQGSREFVELRCKYRQFIFPMGLAVFCWFMTFVLFATYEQGFMNYRLFGPVSVGLLLGILQFLGAGAVTILYRRFARRAIDPRVEEIQRCIGAAEK